MSTAVGWTGREARALRLARRMSVRAYAASLGVSAATVGNWDSRGYLARLRTDTQQMLDIDLARAPEDVKERFAALTQDQPRTLATDGPTPAAVPDRDAAAAADVGRLLPRITEIVLGTPVPDSAELLPDGIPFLRLDPPRRIGEDDVARIEATTRVFRDWDNQWGGGLSGTAVIAQVQWVAACAAQSHCASSTARTRLLTALADLAGVAAFLCYDMLRHPQARALWLLGLRASSEAGNADLVGTTLRQLAHQALHLHQPDEALRLVRLAYTTTMDRAHNTSELALAEIAAYEGWCYAAAGNVQPCHRALGRAQDHFDSAEGDQPPPWLAHLDRPELTALVGHAYHVLAHHEPAMAVRAADLLRTAVDGRASHYARSRTLNLMALSATYFQRGDDIEEGIAIGDQALNGAGTLQSPRALDRLRALRQLTDPHTGKPGVPALRQRIDLVLSDA